MSPSSVSEILQPETLVKVMKKLTLNPSAKPTKYHRRQRVRLQVKSQPVENRSERIMREVQSAFPRRRVRTLLSVLKDPIARMRRFVRVSCVCGRGLDLRATLASGMAPRLNRECRQG